MGDEGGPQEMACNELVDLVTEYIERRLPPADVRRFERHLEECDGCHIYLEQMRATIAALGHLPRESLPPEARAELLEAFRGWTAGR